jgi:hypothetical protein
MKKEPAALIRDLRRTFKAMACPEHAAAAQRYMKSEMPHYGIRAQPLRKACKEVFERHPLESFEAWRDAVLALYRGAKHREERYAAIELTGLKRCVVGPGRRHREPPPRRAAAPPSDPDKEEDATLV